MTSYRRLEDLDLGLWKAVVELYRSDPLTHCYLLYDLVYEPENIDILFQTSTSSIEAYVLLWRGPRIYAIHVWGRGIVELLQRIELPRDKPLFIHLYTEDLKFAKMVAEIVENRRGIDVEIAEFLDMIVDEHSFRPQNLEIARRLGEEDLEAFLEIKRVQGWEVDRDLARGMIERGRYYGVYADGKLVAIAGRYIALPEVWVVGDVYVLPGYRGRGYGKAVVSAITRDAVASGALALLHVDSANRAAIELYRKLGYRVVRKRLWLMYRNG